MMTEWISCKDRLPDKDEYVSLTFHQNKKIRKDVFYDFFYKRFEEEKGNDWTGSPESPVIYWMPFPNPPEEE